MEEGGFQRQGTGACGAVARNCLVQEALFFQRLLSLGGTTLYASLQVCSWQKALSVITRICGKTRDAEK